jgi:phage-related protein
MFRRLKEAWFEFKGIRSSDMGIMLRSMPTRTAPAQKFTRKSVSGRDGTVKVSGGEYGDSSVQLEMDVIDERNMAAVLGWLSGSGDLRFSDEPDLIYTNATIDKEYARKSIIPRATAQRFTVKWTCDPFRKLHTPADPIEIYSSGTAINNPGTAEALPRIIVSGSGDFSITIGMQTMFFYGVEGGIIIDSEAQDALTADGAQLANDKTDGALFKIQPGQSIVQWLTGGEDSAGSISKITIEPRWRYL